MGKKTDMADFKVFIIIF